MSHYVKCYKLPSRQISVIYPIYYYYYVFLQKETIYKRTFVQICMLCAIIWQCCDPCEANRVIEVYTDQDVKSSVGKLQATEQTQYREVYFSKITRRK